VRSSVTSTCFVASISLISTGSREGRVDDMVFRPERWQVREGCERNAAEQESDTPYKSAVAFVDMSRWMRHPCSFIGER
jgi:hypothetical protein